mgnify:CR=1 FL=1
MRLADWLIEQGKSPRRLTQEQFAQEVGTSSSTISRLVSGRRRPSLDLARRISEVTDGKVTANDFVSEADDEPEPVRSLRSRVA